MTRRLVEASVKARYWILLLAGTSIAVGVWQLGSASIEALPEFRPPIVEIQTEALGLSAKEVEQLITVPLEQDLLAGLPWLENMRSKSILGLSSIELTFEPGTDLFRARQVVQERLTQAAGLPNVSSPPQMLQPLASTSRVMMLRLSSETVSPIDLSVLARWTIRPRLLGVPGVANVSIWGQQERQLQVQVDPERLRRHGVSLDSVIEATGNALWASPLTFLEASTPGTGGFIDTANQRLGVQHLQPITTAADLAKVPVDAGTSRSVALADVADVLEDHQPLIGDAVFTDTEPGLLLVIEKFPGANTVEVTHGLEEALDALRPGLTGVHLDPDVYRPAGYVERSFSNLRAVSLAGFGLLLVALALLFADLRSWLACVGAIAVSLATATGVLLLLDAQLDMLSVTGLVVGLAVIVLHAVTSVEAARRRSARNGRNGDRPSPFGAATADALENPTPLFAASIIAAIAVVPLLFLQGEVAPFVPKIAVSYVVAIAVSVLVALAVSPALAASLQRPGGSARRSVIVAWLQRRQHRVLQRAIDRPRYAYAVAGILLVGGLLTLPFLERSPLPSFRDGTVLVDWRGLPGTSLPEMDRITRRVGMELAALSGVLDVGAHVGRAITSDQVVDADTGQLWVSIDPEADYEATVASIRRVVAGYPGITTAVRTYTDERIGRSLSNAGPPVDVRLYGDSYATLQRKANDVLGMLRGVDGIVRPRTQAQLLEPSVDVQVDLREADRYGIAPGDVRRAAAAFVSGIGVGSLFEQQKVFDVVVWGTPEARTSLTSLRRLSIDTPGGGSVALDRVANVAVEPTPPVIRHEDTSPTVDVVADVQGRSVEDVIEDVREKLRAVSFPLEYHAELVGDFADRQAARSRAIEVTIAVAIVILLILQATFGSWRLAALLFLVPPLAVTGGLIALVASGTGMTLGSLFAFAAVGACSVLSGMTLCSRYRQLERGESVPFGPALIQRGAHERVLSTVGSALVAAIALVPYALTGGPGEDILRPAALVAFGGALASIPAVCVALPVLYLHLAPSRSPERAPADVVHVRDTVGASGA